MRHPSDASCLSLSEKAHALAGRPACVENVTAPIQINSSRTQATSNPSDARCIGWQVCLQMPLGCPAVRSGLCVPPWGSQVTLPLPATAFSPAPTLGRAFSMYDARRDKRFQPMTTSCPSQLPGGRRCPLTLTPHFGGRTKKMPTPPWSGHRTFNTS